MKEVNLKILDIVWFQYVWHYGKGKTTETEKKQVSQWLSVAKRKGRVVRMQKVLGPEKTIHDSIVLVIVHLPISIEWMPSRVKQCKVWTLGDNHVHNCNKCNTGAKHW